MNPRCGPRVHSRSPKPSVSRTRQNRLDVNRCTRNVGGSSPTKPTLNAQPGTRPGATRDAPSRRRRPTVRHVGLLVVERFRRSGRDELGQRTETGDLRHNYPLFWGRALEADGLACAQHCCRHRNRTDQHPNCQHTASWAHRATRNCHNTADTVRTSLASSVDNTASRTVRDGRNNIGRGSRTATDVVAGRADTSTGSDRHHRPCATTCRDTRTCRPCQQQQRNNETVEIA